MELKVIVPGSKAKSASVTISDKLFARDFNEPLIHQVVTAYLAAGRAGTAAQKTRAEVRGGGKKPWQQKGTGRARAGTSRSPLWRGGGIVFAAKPRDYSQKVNKKMYLSAMGSILSELIRQERLIILNELTIKEPKTKLLKVLLNELKIENALIMVEEIDHNLKLAARNIPNIKIQKVLELNPADLVRYKKVLMTEAALKKIEERLG